MNPSSRWCLLAFAAGCARSSPNAILRPLAVPGDSAEYAGLAERGTIDLGGEVFLIARTGEVKPGAGRLVTLDPATIYARRWFRRMGADLGRFDAPPPDPRFAAARRIATTDAGGRFRITRLKPGDYLLRSSVTWESPTDSSRQGGVVAALITVRAGEENEIVLSRLYTADSTAMLVVPILSDTELMAKPFRLIGKISGSSCDTEIEAPARKDLVYEAGRKGADAVAHVACRKRGFSLAGGCLRRIVCEGDGVVWL